jgi:colanic acid biosynthesis protein WcaH
MSGPGHLPAEEYQQMLRRIPILCVDGVLTNDRGQYLLVRRINAPMKGDWWVPGGRVLKGESLEGAFARKMREELGIPVTILGPIGYFEVQHEDDPRGEGDPVHQVSIVFAAEPQSLDIRLDGQSAEWGFFDRLPERFSRFVPFTPAATR